MNFFELNYSNKDDKDENKISACNITVKETPISITSSTSNSEPSTNNMSRPIPSVTDTSAAVAAQAAAASGIYET